MIKKQIKEVYKGSVKGEWRRLVKDAYHQLEFETTLRFLKKDLPTSGLILDAGGGPGRYTIELAKLGYQMVLLDLTPELLIKAKREISKAGVADKVERILEGTITDLSTFNGNSFDAVVCLGGPLSHVQSEEERNKAMAELVRVTKSGGVIAISVMGKLGCLIQGLKYWPKEIEISDHFRELWKNGDDDMWHGVSNCHYFLTEEITDLVEKSGIEIWDRVGLEGLTQFKEGANKMAKYSPQAWKNWLEAHEALCTRLDVFAVSGHMLVIGKKK
jgi:S-adenosylmethionine-dependent methyltransferase